MTRPLFQFSNVVLVEGNLIGVIVKSWGPIMRGGSPYGIICTYTSFGAKADAERKQRQKEKSLSKRIKAQLAEAENHA